MSFTIIEKEGELWLELPEELTVQHVEALKESLRHASENSLPLKVQASRLKNTHTAVIQLLLVWKKSGRRLDLVDPSVELTKFMHRLGIKT